MHLTPAGWYAVLVSVTLFQFLLGLSLWEWLLWTLFAVKLSRLNLRLVATHPDGHGGLGFLGLTPVAFAPVVFAASTVIGATWRHDLHDGTNDVLSCVRRSSWQASPWTAGHLPRSWLRAPRILEYGILGQMQSSDFQEKWIQHRTGHEPEFLAAPESSSLADYGRTYERLEQLRPFPADRGALIALGVSVVLPMLPVILAVIPLVVVLKALLKALG
jgi:hypothetical protein